MRVTERRQARARPIGHLYQPAGPIGKWGDLRMTDVTCPVCGKTFSIPEGRGRAVVESHFLRHKDACRLPREDEFVRVTSRVGVVVEVRDGPRGFPVLTVQFPSGRMRDLGACEVAVVPDQEEGRRRFYE